MSKATPQMLLDLGFAGVQFNIASASGTITFMQDVLNEVAVEVEAQVGSAVYASTTEPVKQRVINAEKYMAAALLEKRQLAALSRSPGSTDGKATGWAEMQERNDYREMASRNIALITGALDESFAAAAYEPEAAQ